MKIFENIIKEAEKRHLKDRNMRYFKSCLTDEALNEFKTKDKKINDLFCANYDVLLKYKWHLNSDSSRLYKEDSDAYLIRGENGYIIDESIKQSNEALEEESALLFHGNDVVTNIYKYVVLYEEFHTKDWETKPDVDRQTFEYVAQSLGYLKGKELEQEKDKPKTM